MEKQPLVVVSWPLSPNRVLTKENLIEALKIDENLFDIQRCVLNKWDTSMKWDSGEIIVSENYQVKMYLIPKMTDDLRVAAKVFEDMLAWNMPETAYAPREISNNGRLWTIALADAHIDKLNVEWISMKKKIAKIREAIIRLVDKIDRYWIEKFLFVNLWDYFNSDGSARTTKWTPQDNMAFEYDSWKQWAELQIAIIQIMKQIANVSVIFTEWNHDWHKLKYLRDMCAAYFKDDSQVDVVECDKERIYYPRGKTWLWFTHGANAKEKDLPMLAQREMKTKHDVIEIFKWHIHQARIVQFPGAIVETVSQASGKWKREENNWYWTNTPTISWYVHGKKTWREAHFLENI